MVDKDFELLGLEHIKRMTEVALELDSFTDSDTGDQSDLSASSKG